MGHIGASGREASMSLTLFITSLSVWKVFTSTFKQRSKKNCFFFLTTTQSGFLPQRAQPPLVRMMTESEVGFIIEGQVRCGGSPEMAGWPGGSVLGKQIGFGFVYLYCTIGATLFPFVCICIDVVYDIFPCHDLFIFCNVKLNWFG